MVRLWALAVFFGFAIWFVTIVVSQSAARARSERTHRPWLRWGWWLREEARGEPGTMHFVQRSELAGLRDAYSSAPLDPAQPLLRCGSCLAMYHATSVHELDRANGGRCVVCGDTDLAAVHLADG